MNCHHFENVINELARGSLMEAATRENALRHTEECARCSARLADERALTEGMHALAARTQTLDAPARVEAALLAAFRERRAVASITPETKPAMPATVAPVMIADAHIWWMPRWAQGAAAAAAAVILVVGLYGIFKNQTSQTPGAVAGNPASSKNNARAESEPAPAVGDSNIMEAASGEGGETESTPAPSPQRATTLPNATKGSYQLASYNPRGRKPATRDAALDTAQAPEEVVTDFIPLMNGGRLAPDDAGHVVRVELPRMALASFGLPVNADRAEGRVKADVLMGADGIARAIRFVQ